jgi:hypothetical protein
MVTGLQCVHRGSVITRVSVPSPHVQCTRMSTLFHVPSGRAFSDSRETPRVSLRTNVELTPLVKDVLAEGPRTNVSLSGWVRSVRSQKRIAFMSLTDGSSPLDVQVVASPPDLLKGCVHCPAHYTPAYLVESAWPSVCCACSYVCARVCAWAQVTDCAAARVNSNCTRDSAVQD